LKKLFKLLWISFFKNSYKLFKIGRHSQFHIRPLVQAKRVAFVRAPNAGSNQAVTTYQQVIKNMTPRLLWDDRTSWKIFSMSWTHYQEL